MEPSEGKKRGSDHHSRSKSPTRGSKRKAAEPKVEEAPSTPNDFALEGSDAEMFTEEPIQTEEKTKEEKFVEDKQKFMKDMPPPPAPHPMTQPPRPHPMTVKPVQPAPEPVDKRAYRKLTERENIKKFVASGMPNSKSKYVSAMYSFKRTDRSRDSQLYIPVPPGSVFISKMHGVGDMMKDDDDDQAGDSKIAFHKLKKYLEIDGNIDPALLKLDPTAQEEFLMFTENIRDELLPNLCELILNVDSTDRDDAVEFYDKAHGTGAADKLPAGDRNRILATEFVKHVDYWHKKKTAGDGKKRAYAGDNPEGSVLRGTRNTFRRPDESKKGIPIPANIPNFQYSHTIGSGEKYSPAEMVNIIEQAAREGYTYARLNFVDSNNTNLIERDPRVADPTFQVIHPGQVWCTSFTPFYKRLTSGRRLFSITWGPTFTYIADPPMKAAQVIQTSMAQSYSSHSRAPVEYDE